MPRFASKRQAVDISQQIGRDISAYLLTITVMNALVGAATALVMWSSGVGDPVLWGTVAFILNYVPILGRRGFFHFPVRRLAHDRLDLGQTAVPTPVAWLLPPTAALTASVREASEPQGTGD